MTIRYIFIFFIPILLFSQDEKLRIETIDVFKEYQPSISNSIKISSQPIFNDTLKTKVVSYKSILEKKINFSDPPSSFLFPKFRFQPINDNIKKYFSIDFGSHTFFKTKFHYTNGLSVKHNSGFYLEHVSEDMRLASPHYKKNNGEALNMFKIYSSRFLNNKIFKTSLSLKRNTGLYWAGLEDLSIDDIVDYRVNNISLDMNLKNTFDKRFFNFFDMKLSSISNNFGRKELSIESSFDLSFQHLLRTYSFFFSTQITQSSTDDINTLALLHHQLVSDNETMIFADGIDDASDMLFHSAFGLNGNKGLDYYLGIHLDYASKSGESNPEMMCFPSIVLTKDINTKKRLEFILKKELVYNSLLKLHHNLPYIDPYYKNSFSRNFITSLTFNNVFHKNVSFYGDLNYQIISDKIVPFLKTDWQEELEDWEGKYMTPLSIFLSEFHGFNFHSSISFSESIYDLILSVDFNMTKSSDYVDLQLIPKSKFSGLLKLNLFQDISLFSNVYYVGKRDVLRLNPISSELEQYNIDSYLDVNLSINYHYKNFIFSLDCKNLLAKELTFYDGFYDDDGRKVRLGFFYKF